MLILPWAEFIMKCRASLVPALGLALVLLTIPALAAAQKTRYLETSGTSGGGSADIIIESFGSSPGERPPGLDRVQAPVYNIHVTVPPGSSAANTTVMLRDSLDFVLPAGYVVTIPSATTTQIHRTTGTFSMSVTSTIVGQTVKPIVTAPGLQGPGLLVLVLALAAAAWFVLVRRKAEGGPDSGTA
jgi:hypothetical protein